MGFLTGIFVGVLCGAGTMLFIQAATKNEHDMSIYMKVFNDGQATPRYMKSEFPLQEKE